MSKNKNKLNLINLSLLTMCILMHIGIVVSVILSYRFYEVQMSIILKLLGILFLIVIIIDILIFVGLRFKIKAMNIITLMITTMFFLGTIYTGYALNKTNDTVDNIIENSGVDQYETIYASIVSY